MDKEIEIKVFEIDKESIEKSLLALGAIKVQEGKIETRYFDTGDNRNKYLRLRIKGGKCIITYKNLILKEGMQMNDEVETIIEDIEAGTQILEALGFAHYNTQYKYRTTYTYQNTAFEFDKYDHLPWFLEIEAPSKEKVLERVTTLGLEQYPQSGSLYDDFGTSYSHFITQLKKTQGIA